LELTGSEKGCAELAVLKHNKTERDQMDCLYNKQATKKMPLAAEVYKN